MINKDQDDEENNKIQHNTLTIKYFNLCNVGSSELHLRNQQKKTPAWILYWHKIAKSVEIYLKA